MTSTGGAPGRRVRLCLAAVGALGLMVLVAILLAGRDDPDVSLTAAGQPTAGEVPPALPATPPEATTTTTTEKRLSVEGIHGRTTPPQPSSSVAPADDPVVRPPTTRSPGTTSGPVAVEPPAVTPPTTAPASASCPASEVQVSVVTAPVYAPGEPVRGSSTIQNRSATTCLLPTRGFVRILNAAGKDVSSFAYTMEYRMPASAEPGKTFSTPITWDQRDCTGTVCVQVPAGTYTVVADWTEGGPYVGRGSFQISA